MNAAVTKYICVCLKAQEIPQHEKNKYKSKFKYLGKAPKHQTFKHGGSKTKLNYWNVVCH